MDLHQQLHWRYATKRMNGQSVPSEKIAKILEAIQLAPTSMGMQPFHVFVISNQELREKIFEGACKQPQVKEGSHVIVFCCMEKCYRATREWLPQQYCKHQKCFFRKPGWF